MADLGMAAPGDWRVGTADRDKAAEALAEHFAAGRLTVAEFQSRLDTVYAATTARELAKVTADLPYLAAGRQAAASAGRPARWSRNGAAAPGRLSRIARLLTLSGLAALGLLVALAVLAAVFIPHGGILAAVLILLLGPLALLGLAAGVGVWIGHRAWRSGAWLEAIPLLAGMPWLGRVMWAVRALLVGKAFWRLGQRAGLGRRQARAGGLSGTTR
jgi:Domain of unknown function (DUF1707)